MDQETWIETLEPETKQIVYANPVTGQIMSEAPKGISFKPMSDNQWWELLDSASNDYYYHNPHTGETVWDRPDSEDILPFTNMGITETTDTVTDSPRQTDSTEKTKPEQLPPVNSPDVFSAPLDTLSPLTVDFNGHSIEQANRFTLFEAEVNAAERHSKQLSESHVEQNNDSYSSNNLPRVVPTESDFQYEGSNRSSIINQNRGYYSLERNSNIPSSLYEFESSSSRPHSRPSSYTTIQDDPFSRKHIGSFVVVSMSDVTNDSNDMSIPGNPQRSVSTKESPRKVSSPTILEGSATLDSKPHSRSKSQGIPLAPMPPPIHKIPSMTRSKSMQADLGKFQELNQHKRGFFRRKVTIANMLCWTKDPIKQPMIFSRDKELRKESVELFKLVLQCMGDRKSKVKNNDELILTIMSRCWEKKGLRDELFIQLCRQTTENKKSESLRRGWELITIALHFFPPSVKFRGYLEGFVWKHIDSTSYKNVPVNTYALYCHKRIEKMVQWGAKKGLRKPTMEEIQYAKTTPFHPSLFGTTLEELMELQKDVHPLLDIPFVIIELCETILRLRGPHTQGIFRIPGDIDEVNALKIHIEKGKPIPPSLADPHIPGSLLKLWFRELEEPLIPESYYQSCIDHCDNPGSALSLVDSLPNLNRKVLLYIIGFLQQFITPESSELTKMGIDNIAMVWAPNFLRCPSDDHVLIFENTRREMSFVRILLKHVDPHSTE